MLRRVIATIAKLQSVWERDSWASSELPGSILRVCTACGGRRAEMFLVVLWLDVAAPRGWILRAKGEETHLEAWR